MGKCCIETSSLWPPQLTFTVTNAGGLVKTYGGPQTYFRVVNAVPTISPYCQFTPVTRPSAPLPAADPC